VALERSTLRGAPVVAAPGKVFLVGEYAVLEEGTAVLAAVNRYAHARFVPGAAPASPLVAEATRRAIGALGELAAALPNGAPLVDTTEFAQAGQKLGVGSSAAAVVAAVGALFEHAGARLATQLDLAHAVADAAHRAAQGGVGSGADVAAAIHGGFLQFLRPRDGKAAVVPLGPPTALHIKVFWTGQASPTVDMLSAVRAFAERSRPLYEWQIEHLRGIADRFARAFAANHARAVIDEAEAYGRALTDLGAASGVTIATPPFAQMADLARALGGAAKPSGAGGGDIGVAFFADADAATELAARCPPGVSVLDLHLGGPGAHRRLPAGLDSFKNL
jgi:mevalonate kinase